MGKTCLLADSVSGGRMSCVCSKDLCKRMLKFKGKKKNLQGKFLKSGYLEVFLLLILKQKQIKPLALCWCILVWHKVFERAELHRVTILGSDIYRDGTLWKNSVEKKTEISLILLNSLFFSGKIRTSRHCVHTDVQRLWNKFQTIRWKARTYLFDSIKSVVVSFHWSVFL